jgi:hypothetical protein
MTLKRGLLIPSLMSILLAITLSQVSLVGSSSDRSVSQSPPPLPKIWQIVWADAVGVPQLLEHKQMGFDGLFKCVALTPNYPAESIYAGGEWRLVERAEGTYDWSSMKTCLDNARQANIWQRQSKPQLRRLAHRGSSLMTTIWGVVGWRHYNSRTSS